MPVATILTRAVARVVVRVVRVAVTVAALAMFVVGCGHSDPVVEAVEPGADRDHGEVVDQPSGEVLDDASDSAAGNAAAPAASPTISSEPAPVESAEPPDPAETPTVGAEPSPTQGRSIAPRPAAPNGRRAPRAARSADQLAAQIMTAEAGLADPGATAEQLAESGHLHQIAIRKLGYRSDWDGGVFAQLPAHLIERTRLHVSARRQLIRLHSGFATADFIPAWAIIEPEPIEMLRAHYDAAEQATGIEWEYLAAVNLMETGMGRIRGLSSAGAKGPMQFLPTTWNEPGIGDGDIDDPGDAIAAAARYLVRRGGPGDMAGALWGYNNSDEYVAAVQAYAEMLRQDAAALVAIYNWEIYFAADAGDIWLPTGYVSPEVVDLDDFLVANPWSAPDPDLG